jgi:NADH dehydrogenase FAD-containing subunit
MIEEEMAKLKAEENEKITKKAQIAEQQAKMIEEELKKQAMPQKSAKEEDTEEQIKKEA